MVNNPEFKGGPGNALSDNGGCGKVSRPLLAALLLGVTGLAHAGIAPQLNYWKATPAGTVTEAGVDFDLQDDLRMGEESILGVHLEWGSVFGRFENLKFTGTGDVTVETDFLGIPLGSQTATVTSRVDFDDWTLGWRPLNWKAFALGLAVKRLDGILDAEEQDSIGSYQVDETFPLLAIGIVAPLGDLGVQFAADGLWVSEGDNTVYEYQLAIERAGEGLQAAFGYRRQRYDIRDGDEALDARVDGFILSLGWAF